MSGVSLAGIEETLYINDITSGFLIYNMKRLNQIISRAPPISNILLIIVLQLSYYRDNCNFEMLIWFLVHQFSGNNII